MLECGLLTGSQAVVIDIIAVVDLHKNSPGFAQ